MCQSDSMAAQPPGGMAAQPPGPSMAPAAAPPQMGAPPPAQPGPQAPDPVLMSLLQGLDLLISRAVSAAPASAPIGAQTAPV